jgi:hypothetical protein
LIQVLDTWGHRINVELYFWHQYKHFNYRIGTLRKEFTFSTMKLVRNDLPQMTPKTLAEAKLDSLKEN